MQGSAGARQAPTLLYQRVGGVHRRSYCHPRTCVHLGMRRDPCGSPTGSSFVLSAVFPLWGVDMVLAARWAGCRPAVKVAVEQSLATPGACVCATTDLVPLGHAPWLWATRPLAGRGSQKSWQTLCLDRSCRARPRAAACYARQPWQGSCGHPLSPCGAPGSPASQSLRRVQSLPRPR